MTSDTLTVICCAALGILLFLLGANVTRQRAIRGAGNQMPTDPADRLLIAQRAHGNAAEYVPTMIVLLLVCSALSDGWWVGALAVSALVVRTLHAVGMLTSETLAAHGPMRDVARLRHVRHRGRPGRHRHRRGRMSRGPVVGVVGHRYVVRRPYADLRVTGAQQAYTDRVAAAGGRPVVLPAGRAVELLDLVDALVLTGGGDLDPALSGTDPGDADEVDRDRDRDEVALVEEARRRRVPLLGVCRGLQVLVVATGGSLVAGLGDTHRLPGVGHRVRTEPGSLVAGLLGAESRTSSLHHHAVGDPGPSLRVTGRADDGVPEAVEWAGQDDWPVLGVQWHPELADDATGTALFGWLVDAARPQSSMTWRTAVPAARSSIARLTSSSPIRDDTSASTGSRPSRHHWANTGMSRDGTADPR